MYVRASPSESVALPVSANGVRTGIVYSAAAFVTTGAWLPFGPKVIPLLSTGPPFWVSPTKPLAPAAPTTSSDGWFSAASVPCGWFAVGLPNVTSKPASLSGVAALPPNAPHTRTVTIPPAGQPGIDSSAALIPAVE